MAAFARARAAAHSNACAGKIAEKYSDKYETWFYFTKGAAFCTRAHARRSSWPIPDCRHRRLVHPACLLGACCISRRCQLRRCGPSRMVPRGIVRDC
jgi:hypothetical protein